MKCQVCDKKESTAQYQVTYKCESLQVCDDCQEKYGDCGKINCFKCLQVCGGCDGYFCYSTCTDYCVNCGQHQCEKCQISKKNIDSSID